MYQRSGCHALSGCGCSRSRGVSLGHDGLSGDLVAPSVGGVDPVTYLQAQVNRFTVTNKAGATKTGLPLELWPLPMPVTGKLDNEWASRVLSVLHSRALFDGDTDLYGRLIREGFPNPVGFVTANLSQVTQIVTTYADLNGVPAASLTGGIDWSLLTDPKVLLVGGVVAAFLWYRSQKGGRR